MGGPPGYINLTEAELYARKFCIFTDDEDEDNFYLLLDHMDDVYIQWCVKRMERQKQKQTLAAKTRPTANRRSR